MNKLKIISLTTGAISALVALITITVSLLNISKDFKQYRIKRWQTVIVFSIIENGTSVGPNSAISFGDIKSKYLDAAQQFADYDLPKSLISDESLQWIVLDLISQRAIVPLPSKNYRVAYESFMMRDPNLEVFSRMQKISERVMYFARTEPNRFTIEQLASKLAPEFPEANIEQIQMVINQGFSLQQIFLDRHKQITATRP